MYIIPAGTTMWRIQWEWDVRYKVHAIASTRAVGYPADTGINSMQHEVLCNACGLDRRAHDDYLSFELPAEAAPWAWIMVARQYVHAAHEHKSQNSA